MIHVLLFATGLAVALGLEARFIVHERRVSREPVDGLVRLVLRAVPLPLSCTRLYLGLVVIVLVVWKVEPTAVLQGCAMITAYGVVGMPAVDKALRRLRTGRGPGGRPEPHPLPPRTLAHRKRRAVGVVLLTVVIALCGVTVVLTDGLTRGSGAVLVALAVVGSVVVQALIVPRIGLVGTHLYLRGGRRTTIVPVELVAGVEPGRRSLTVRLADGTSVTSGSWGRTPGRNRWLADRVRDFVAATRPATEELPPRGLDRERTIPVNLFMAWTGAGLLALHLW
ncbi:hypothetical protein PWG71_23530 [Nocardiopsis sp. N85]|uniref:hypothetical protein n=1 Tax=Nocardiopsis sp. N85 TaxID=3029400 RepID=UPI00237F6BEA|nr:hypothetical protein [Nocardiopsis sp. N85]MDE3724374.1 hypothetical protein [Nocardiopsis sp. N85]